MELRTDVSDQIEQGLRKQGIYFLLVAILVGCQSPQSISTPVQFQLSNPQVTIDSVLFLQTATIAVELDQPGVEIYYATGGESVSRGGAKYEGPITFERSTVLTVQAFHPQFQASDQVTIEVIKARDFSSASVKLEPQPSPTYIGRGADGLIDLNKGTTNFRSGTEWLGFQSPIVKVEITFDRVQTIDGISLSALQSHGDWIFLPARLEVNVGNQVIASREFGIPSEQEPGQLKFLDLPFPDTQNVQSLELTITHHAEIPAWHPGSGTAPWLFIDEIIIK